MGDRNERITREALTPGATFDAPNQGKAITPRTARVKVVSINETDVWYELPPMRSVHTTPIDRFLAILNGDTHD